MGTLAAAYYPPMQSATRRRCRASLVGQRAMRHPTQNVPIYSTDIDALDDTSGNRYVFAVCNRVPASSTSSRVKATGEYDRLGAEVYQYDIWRTPFSQPPADLRQPQPPV